MEQQIKDRYRDTRSPAFENEAKRRLATLVHIFLLADLAILIIYSLVTLLITPGSLFSWLFLGLFSLLGLGLLYQIVQHQRAVAAARANAERLRLALAATGLVIWDWQSQTDT